MKARAALGQKFGAEVDSQKNYQIVLRRRILSEAGGYEANIIPAWLESGCPLGIKADIAHSGAFPRTSEDTSAVEISRSIGRWMEDLDGEATNYSSFNEEPVGSQMS